MRKVVSAIMFTSFSTGAVAQSNIDSADKYVWTENTGWTNWRDANSANDGVIVGTSFVEGFILGESTTLGMTARRSTGCTVTAATKQKSMCELRFCKIVRDNTPHFPPYSSGPMKGRGATVGQALRVLAEFVRARGSLHHEQE